jgi:hypothetical protein
MQEPHGVTSQKTPFLVNSASDWGMVRIFGSMYQPRMTDDDDDDDMVVEQLVR